MAIKDLISSIEDKKLDNKVKNIAQNLVYRDFITVGILLEKLKINNDTNFKTINNIIPDNWIYIQESDVKVGRIQVFNNWSPYMIENPDKVWIGLEYFCNVGDEIWSLEENELKEFAINELVKLI